MLWKPRFGTRRCSGIWPPSNPRLCLNPDRDFAPLWPRPAVLPLPDPCPRPIRFFACLAPRGGFKSERLINSILDRHQVSNFVNHAARCGRVLQLDGVSNPAQAQAAHHGALVAVEADWALEQRHLDRAALLGVSSLVGHAVSLLCLPAPAGRGRACARSMPGPSTNGDPRWLRGRRYAGWPTP